MAGVSLASEDVPPRRFALRPRMLRALVWLRWRLLLRRISSSTSAVVGLVLSLIFLLPLAALIALGTILGYTFLLGQGQTLQAQNLLFLVLAGLYGIWAILPLLQYTLNEGLDVTKLVQYPLTRLELMSSLLVSMLFDVPTLFILIIYAGVVVGWASDWPTALATAGVMLLAFIQTIALSQLLLAALMGLLRSRRFRDLSIVLATLFGLSCSLLFQIFGRTAGRGTVDALGQILSADIGSWLQFLPPGMAGRAVAAIVRGDVLGALGWTAALAITIIPVMWAWSAILERGLASPEQAATSARSRRRAGRRQPATVTPVADLPVAVGVERSLIPVPALAIATKELRYYWRDPQYKRVFLSSLYLIGILLLPLLGGENLGARASTQYVILAAVFLVQGLTTSIFGYEGAATSTLALFPVRGAHVFLGKNLAALTVGLAAAALLLILQGVINGQWTNVAAYAVAAVAAMFASLGPGDVIAVVLPLRVARTGLGRAQTDSGTGCMTFLLNSLAYTISLILILPIGAALVIPQFAQHPEWQVLTLPAALAYGIGIYGAGLAIAANLYYQRLPEIMKVVVKE